MLKDEICFFNCYDVVLVNDIVCYFYCKIFNICNELDGIDVIQRDVVI